MFYQSWPSSWDKKRKEKKDGIQPTIIIKELKSYLFANGSLLKGSFIEVELNNLSNKEGIIFVTCKYWLT